MTVQLRVCGHSFSARETIKNVSILRKPVGTKRSESMDLDGNYNLNYSVTVSNTRDVQQHVVIFDLDG